MAATRPIVEVIALSNPLVRMSTRLGDIVVRIDETRAPLSAGAFLDVVDGYAGGMTFWRAVAMHRDDGSVLLNIVQGGTLDVAGFPRIAHEPDSETGLRNVRGAVSLGRFEPGSATGAAFFISIEDNPLLDAGSSRGDGLGYAVFGHVEQGMDVARMIQTLPIGDDAPMPVLKGQVLREPVPILSMQRLAQ